MIGESWVYSYSIALLVTIFKVYHVVKSFIITITILFIISFLLVFSYYLTISLP